MRECGHRHLQCVSLMGLSHLIGGARYWHADGQIAVAALWTRRALTVRTCCLQTLSHVLRDGALR